MFCTRKPLLASAETYLPKEGDPLRNHERVFLDISIRIFPDVLPTLGRTQDFSAGGMSFYAPLDLKVGDFVRLAFELPHSQVRFNVSSVVKNRNGFRFGAEFVGLTAEQAAEIQRVTRIVSLTNR